MADKVQKFFNNAQLEAMSIAANCEYIVASRGFGKSEGIDAPRLLRNVLHMPGSCGALLSPTYGKLLTNTLPAISYALERLGYIKGLHYFIGKTPPQKLNFRRPLRQPDKADYFIFWFNGSVNPLISFERTMSANSMNLDYVMGFEARYLPYNKMVDEVFPALRGNKNLFINCPWHGGQVFSTDMPITKSGMWIFEKQKLMDEELIEDIKLISLQLQYYNSIATPENPYDNKIKTLNKDLFDWRSHAIFYAEYDIFENLEIIGEKKIKEFKRDLPPFLFNTSILNKRPRNVANGFYAALNEKIHCYDSYDNSYLESLDYDFNRSTAKNCRKDGDIDKDLPLRIALDYNASINNVVTGQSIDNELRTLNWHFVKTPRKLKELLNDWADYYEPLPNRDVIYYYDSTAISESADGDAKPFYQIVIDTLRQRGWNVNAAYIGQQMRHNKKHNYIDMALKGDNELLFPTFNRDNTEMLFFAMEQTGVKYGRNGFEKNKDMEKLADTPDNPDELKTHGTDAWDTLFVGCNFFNVNMQSLVPTGTVY